MFALNLNLNGANIRAKGDGIYERVKVGYFVKMSGLNFATA